MEYKAKYEELLRLHEALDIELPPRTTSPTDWTKSPVFIQIHELFPADNKFTIAFAAVSGESVQKRSRGLMPPERIDQLHVNHTQMGASSEATRKI
jgi:hypothetical protein